MEGMSSKWNRKWRMVKNIFIRNIRRSRIRRQINRITTNKIKYMMFIIKMIRITKQIFKKTIMVRIINNMIKIIMIRIIKEIIIIITNEFMLLTNLY
jgi:hypothetical protein